MLYICISCIDQNPLNYILDILNARCSIGEPFLCYLDNTLRQLRRSGGGLYADCFKSLADCHRDLG